MEVYILILSAHNNNMSSTVVENFQRNFQKVQNYFAKRPKFSRWRCQPEDIIIRIYYVLAGNM